MVYINIQAVGNDRPAALEQKDGVRPVREAHRLLRPVGCFGVAAQPQELTVMRRKHDRTGTSAQHIYMRRSGVYAVRVQNERRAADGKDRLHQPRQLLRAAKTGAEQHSVHFGKPRCNRRQRGHAEPPCLVARERKDDLAPRACGDDRIDFLRHAEIHKAAARAERGLCRKPCRAGQSLGAAEQKDSAVITLVALPPPDRQQLPNQLPVRALCCPCRSCHFRSPPY